MASDRLIFGLAEHHYADSWLSGAMRSQRKYPLADWFRENLPRQPAGPTNSSRRLISQELLNSERHFLVIERLTQIVSSPGIFVHIDHGKP